MNIIELLKPSDKIALIQGNKQITYAELLERGLRYGEKLKRKGIGAGKCVRLFKPMSIELYIALIGIWSIGAVPAFSWSRLKVDKLEPIDDETPAILTCTSGSTGVPKTAVRTHEFLIRQYNVLCKHLDFDENHIDFGTLPIFTLANLAAGMTTILPNKSYRGIKLPNNLDKITRAICSPATFQRMMEKSDLPNLRQVYLGGAPVYPSLLEKIRKDIDVYVVYGSTEAEPIAKVKWNDVSAEDKAKIAHGAGLLVGEIVPQIKLEIADDNEIIISGDTVLKGYYGGVGDSENKIREGDKVWHRTGDAGYIDEQGRLWLTGRVSHFIKLDCSPSSESAEPATGKFPGCPFGHATNGTLSPFSIECVLDTHFGIRGAVLLHNGKRTVVIDKDIDAAEVLKPFGIEQVIKVKKLPMDKRHNAKIDYVKLRRKLNI